MPEHRGGWRVTATVPARAEPEMSAALEALGCAVAIKPIGGGRHRIQAYGAGVCDRDAIARTLGVAPSDVAIEALPETDWAARLQRDFPPIRVGRFFVHGSHHRGRAPRGTIPIRIDAGAAFGTGSHESTEGCLTALERMVAARRHPNTSRILDMGTGSGILAIAAAKALGAPVLALDSDAKSVEVARENVRLNDVEALVTVARAVGYRGVAAQARFDLVLANILARPLIRMAPALARRLAPGGAAVLSGLLSRDAKKVLAAHRAQGLALADTVEIGDWTTLVVRRALSRARKR